MTSPTPLTGALEALADARLSTLQTARWAQEKKDKALEKTLRDKGAGLKTEIDRLRRLTHQAWGADARHAIKRLETAGARLNVLSRRLTKRRQAVLGATRLLATLNTILALAGRLRMNK